MEYKGLAIENEKVELVDENIVASVDLVHEGKIGGLKVNVSGHFKFLPLVNTLVDKLEELIPGDQKVIASIIKDQIAKIKIKF